MRGADNAMMKGLKLPLAIVLAILAWAVFDFARHYPQLPERVASHFNAAGQADGWATKREFAMSWAVVLAILAFVFGLTLAIISVAPASAFNLPHKDYWMAPDRAPAARRLIAARMLWFVAGLVLFMAYLAHGIVQLNLAGGGQLTAWVPLGVFLAFTVLWCGELYWRFARVPREAA